MAQLMSENLMVVPSTADGFRAVVSALRSIDGKDGVSFHTFTLLEDRYPRLLVKNLGRGMPESIVREQLESLNICVQGVTSCDLAVAIPTPTRTALPPPTSLCLWRADLSCPRCDHSPNSAVSECRWRRTWLQKVRCNASAASVSATRSSTADTHLGASLVGAHTSAVGALTRGTGLCAVAAGETTQRTTVAL